MRTFALMPQVGPRNHRLDGPGYLAFLMKFLLLTAACMCVGFAVFSMVPRLPGGFSSSSGSDSSDGLVRLVGFILAGTAIFAPLGFMCSPVARRHFLSPLQGMAPALAGAFVLLLFVGMSGGFFTGALLTARL